MLTATTCHPQTNWDDSKISVFCNSEVGCDMLLCIDGNNDDPECDLAGPGFEPALLSTVRWCSEVDEIYYILLHGFGGSTGDFVLTIMPAAFLRLGHTAVLVSLQKGKRIEPR